MGVVSLRTYRDPTYMPLLVLLDTQIEYVAENRALCLGDVTGAVSNCRRLLIYAREVGMPVAFLRWQQRGKFFGKTSETSGWIEGLTPTGADMVFDRDLPSAYANREFASMMDSGGGENAVLAGFTGTLACLSTVIEAYHRQHNVTFVSDASASHPLCSLEEGKSHEAAVDIARLYGGVTTAEDWIRQQENKMTRAWGALT